MAQVTLLRRSGVSDFLFSSFFVGFPGEFATGRGASMTEETMDQRKKTQLGDGADSRVMRQGMF